MNWTLTGVHGQVFYLHSELMDVTADGENL